MNANTSTSASAPVTAIVLEKLTKLFGRLAAIREIDFTFKTGTLYVLLGDNGAGKSTLLRMLAGLSQPTGGKVELISTTRDQFGYMAHASLLYDELSGLENLEYFAKLYRVHDSQIPPVAAQQMGHPQMGRPALTSRLDPPVKSTQVGHPQTGHPQIGHPCRDAMTSVGLDPALTRPVRDYSQGMRQRLSLARAILHAPRVILLDEPFSNVDAASTAQMTRLLGQLRDSGCTIIVVTHQPAVLAQIGDEFLTMASGKIVETRKRSQLRPTEVGQ